jgi:hypothetical protein
MRFYEFSGVDTGIDQFAALLHNLAGRAASAKKPLKMNWQSVSQLGNSIGMDLVNYDTFKSMYDNDAAIQSITKDFDRQYLELKVAGVSDQDETDTNAPPSQSVDDIAAGAAEKQMAQSEKTPPAPKLA